MKMSDPPVRNDIELPPAVHWPTVYAMAGVGGSLVAVLMAVAVTAAVQNPPSPKPEEPAAVALVLPAPQPRTAVPAAKPAAPAENPTPEGPQEWKPLVPHVNPPPPPVPVKRIVQAPDLNAMLEPNRSRPAPVHTPSTYDAAADPVQAPLPLLSFPTKVVSKCDYQVLQDLETNTAVVDLNAVEGASAALMPKSTARRKTSAQPKVQADPSAAAVVRPETVMDLMARRADLTGLPVREESECMLPEKAAQRAESISASMRRLEARTNRAVDQIVDPLYYAPDDKSHKELLEFLSRQPDWLTDENVPLLAQMLCVETPAIRLHLTRMLAFIKERQAGVALARQALFDVSPVVREAAVNALKARPNREFRQTLLDGLRYPWPPVADHAAEALVALEMRDVAQPLADMLALPDPSAPMRDEKKGWVKAEVVKANHFRNCLLCHAPSSSPEDHVRGFIPKPGEKIPVMYYDNPEGDFVRADVTYLRQDFSVMESVSDPGKWPSMQRFDYMVRRRPLTDQEIIDMADAALAPSPSYPQREAVRRTLEALAGQESDPSSRSTAPGGPMP